MQKIFRSFWLFVGLMFIPLSAFASDQLAQGSSLPAWVGMVTTVLCVLSHAMAFLPPEVERGLPSWLRAFLQYVAANYGSSKNRHE